MIPGRPIPKVQSGNQGIEYISEFEYIFEFEYISPRGPHNVVNDIREELA